MKFTSRDDWKRWMSQMTGWESFWYEGWYWKRRQNSFLPNLVCTILRRNYDMSCCKIKSLGERQRIEPWKISYTSLYDVGRVSSIHKLKFPWTILKSELNSAADLKYSFGVEFYLKTWFLTIRDPWTWWYDYRSEHLAFFTSFGCIAFQFTQ